MDPVTCVMFRCSNSQLENKSLGANSAKNLELRGVEASLSSAGGKSSSSALPSINDFGGFGRETAGLPAAGVSSAPSGSAPPVSIESRRMLGAADTVRHTKRINGDSQWKRSLPNSAGSASLAVKQLLRTLGWHQRRLSVDASFTE